MNANKTFPNQAGDHPDNDDILRAELKAAGIQTIQEAEGKPPEFLADLFRRHSGEVKTSVIGALHGWEFKRAWRYWVCSGPGLDVATAMKIHLTHGQQVRVDGDAGCQSPIEQFKGLGTGHYHVDTPEGLKVLADAIKETVAKASSYANGMAGWTSVEESLPPVGKKVFAGFWRQDKWLKGEPWFFDIQICQMVPEEDTCFPHGKRWITNGCSHNDIKFWRDLIDFPVRSTEA